MQILCRDRKGIYPDAVVDADRSCPAIWIMNRAIEKMCRCSIDDIDPKVVAEMRFDLKLIPLNNGDRT